MKKLIHFLAFLLLSYVSLAQSIEEDIRADVESYFSLLREEKISEALDYVYPDLINMMGKEMFEQQYNKLLNDANMKASFGDIVINNLSEIKAHEKGDFALLEYTFDMDYVLNHDSDQVKDIMANALQSQFKEGFKRDGDQVKVTAKREMFVIRRSDFEGWKILDYEPGMKMILTSIIPKEIFDHFNK